MTDPDPDADARDFAHESLAGGDPTAWFDRLYTAAADGRAIVPWDRGTVHPMFRQWAEATEPRGHGSRAVIIGCGTGENAEYLSAHGFDTAAPRSAGAPPRPTNPPGTTARPITS